MRYFSRLSGPILDRIDIQITVPPVTTLLTADTIPAESSARIRERVIQARHTAQERFARHGWSCNAQASGSWLRDHTSRAALQVIDRALNRERLSLRGADRSMRLAWTLADLAGADSPTPEHVLTAIGLRTEDRP